MVALTEAVNYEDIVKRLSKKDRIAIVSCNTCVRFIGTGGEGKIDELASRLRNDGFTVTDQVLVTMGCVEQYLRDLHISTAVNKIIVLACKAGIANARRVFPDKEIIGGTKTKGLVVLHRELGVEKLMMAYKEYKGDVGKEYALFTGEEQREEKIKMEVEK
ncbi:MAG: hypothetical protein DRN20_01800 [Thermoplasmata archaeon]|nr:MAG: hypothetical protein DRN20_01800 [Thermoplasmata archaeon]